MRAMTRTLMVEIGQSGRGQSVSPRTATQKGVATPDKPQGRPSATLQSHTALRLDPRSADPISTMNFQWVLS